MARKRAGCLSELIAGTAAVLGCVVGRHGHLGLDGLLPNLEALWQHPSDVLKAHVSRLACGGPRYMHTGFKPGLPPAKLVLR